LESKAIEWLNEHGPDFGSTFAQEKLIEYENINVSVGTIRTWHIKHGLYNPRSKKNKKQFKCRERKPLFGLMVQIDGSPHAWFEDRGDACMLLTAIDDATGKIIARFAREESTIELMILMQDYAKKYGRPHMAYTDHGSPYKVNVGNLEGTKMTQLGRAFNQLDIELVHAHSPQAKGRVERNHGTHQDRLVKEMRLRGISTIEDANRYLKEEYLPDFNKRFVVEPAGTQDAHRSINGFNLDTIFCIQEKRIVQNDSIVQFEKQILQITKNSIYAQPKSSVLVCKHLDNTITLWVNQHQLGYDCLPSRPTPQPIPTQRANIQPRPLSQASRNWVSGTPRPYKLRHDYGTIETQSSTIEGK
jgi:hypothetical protein